MRIFLLGETFLAVLSQILVMFVLRRIYHTHGMRSKAWIIIGAAFFVLLLKWIYGAYLIYHFRIVDTSTVKYEALTALAAGLLLLGFYVLSLELSAGERFAKYLRRSITISNNIIEEKEK